MKRRILAPLLLLALVALWRVTTSPGTKLSPSSDTIAAGPHDEGTEPVRSHQAPIILDQRTWVWVALKHDAGSTSGAIIAKLREAYQEARVEENPAGLIFKAYLNLEEIEWLRGITEVYGVTSLDDYVIPN